MAVTVLYFDPKSMSDETLRRAMMLLRTTEGATRAEAAHSMIESGHYVEIAKVEGTPETAWMKLQNVNRAWSARLPSGVTLIAARPVDKNGRKMGHRSMDVGDIVRKEDGTLWICATCGFEQI